MPAANATHVYTHVITVRPHKVRVEARRTRSGQLVVSIITRSPGKALEIEKRLRGNYEVRSRIDRFGFIHLVFAAAPSELRLVEQLVRKVLGASRRAAAAAAQL